MKNERLPIPFARAYEVAPNGNVYRKGKRLKTRWVSGADYASLYCDDGTRKSVNMTRVSRTLFSESRDGLSPSFIRDRLGARTVRGWPRYAFKVEDVVRMTWND